jgi:Putative peptidoglycan binding domain/L,D-transpeptidase catalytic domain
MTPPARRPSRPKTRAQRDVRRAIAVLAGGAVLIGLVSLVQTAFEDTSTPVDAAPLDKPAVVAVPTTTLIASSAPGVSAAPATEGSVAGQDLSGDEPNATGTDCKMDKRSVRQGDTGNSVTCLQQALVNTGYLSGTPSGTFDQETYDAATKLQTAKDMFVDGIVGRETAIALGIWPDEQSLVVHTKPPKKGAKDLLGYTLSSVATSGPDAPPLPQSSGSGKRVVYDRAGQRAWAIDKNERVIRSWLVSGSKYNNEIPGTYKIYSRSEQSTAWNGKAYLPKMIRWLKTDLGNIGFHGIPRHVADGTLYEKDSELGTRLSGGCQRQADLDAAFMWDFAQIGTTVVVL